MEQTTSPIITIKTAWWKVVRPYLLINLTVITLMVLFFGPTDNWSWDPSYYYAQMRSPLIDGDLILIDEIIPVESVTRFTSNGLIPSVWPVGPGILWSPFFLLAHLLKVLFNPETATGYTSLYIAFVSAGSAFYGLIGTALLYKIARFFAGRWVSLTAMLLGMLATPLAFYIFRQPIMAHTTGLLTSAFLVLVYLEFSKQEGISKYSGLLFGLALGLCALTRWHGILFGIFPAFYFFSFLPEKKRGQVLLQVAIFSAVFIITISPQLVYWYRLYGQLTIAPQNPLFFTQTLLPVNSLNVIFHTNRGVLFWCPFVLVGAAGLMWVKDRPVKLMTGFILLSMILILGYRVDWFSGGGVGARYFIELLPVLVIGFAALAQALPQRREVKTAIIFTAILIVVHQTMLVYSVEQMANGWISSGVRYGQGEALGIRWQLRNLARLALEPENWFATRPFVAENRQTVITQIMSGTADRENLQIPAMAAGLMMVLTSLAWFMKQNFSEKNTVLLTAGVIIFLIGWSFLYLLV